MAAGRVSDLGTAATGIAVAQREPIPIRNMLTFALGHHKIATREPYPGGFTPGLVPHWLGNQMREH